MAVKHTEKPTVRARPDSLVRLPAREKESLAVSGKEPATKSRDDQPVPDPDSRCNVFSDPVR